jgi:hypothetical protein
MSGSIGTRSFWGRPAFAVLGVGFVAVLLVTLIAGGILLGGSPAATPSPGSSVVAAIDTPSAALATPSPAAAGSVSGPSYLPASPEPTAGPSATATTSSIPTAAPTAPPPRDTATPIANPCAAPAVLSHAAPADPAAQAPTAAAAEPSAGNLSLIAALASGHFGRAGAFPPGGGYDTATRLANGKVLFVGGGRFGDRAELYDPATDTFKSTGSLVQARRQPMAALLPNGKVLIVGGGPVSGCVDFFFREVELYDPGTGWFATIGTPLPGDNYDALTRLADGRILITGGSILDEGGDTSHRSSVIYDATAAGHPNGTFTPIAATIPTGSGGTATLLGDGRVLFAGGDAGSGPTTSAGLYDPATDTFMATGSMHVGRANATATLLPGGKGVLIAGGDDGNSTLLTAEIFDSTTSAFELAPSPMTAARSGGVATLLLTGEVLIVGGRPLDANDASRASAELYDPQTGHFAATGSLTSTRSGSLTATLLANGRVLVMWGGGADLYQP